MASAASDSGRKSAARFKPLPGKIEILQMIKRPGMKKDGLISRRIKSISILRLQGQFNRLRSLTPGIPEIYGVHIRQALLKLLGMLVLDDRTGITKGEAVSFSRVAVSIHNILNLAQCSNGSKVQPGPRQPAHRLLDSQAAQVNTQPPYGSSQQAALRPWHLKR